MAQRLSSSCGAHSIASGFGIGIVPSLLLLLLWSGASLAANAGNEPTAGAGGLGLGLSEQVVDQLSENDLYNNNKRAWQSLQSSWGKRSGNELETDDAIFVTGHFVPLVVTDGANTIDWNAFERLASGNQERQSPPSPLQLNEEADADLSGDLSLAGDASNTMEKRAWKNMNVAWGKRRQAQGWNKFRGAWGKREPTWNNLKGMWGKRDQWQKLHGGWGKRAVMN